MTKETYERIRLDIITFTTEDVITTSGEEYEDDLLGGNGNIRPQLLH